MKFAFTSILILFTILSSFSQDANIYFDTDKDNIRSTETSKLKEIQIQYFTSNYQLLLVGHCDEAGSNEYNIELSKRRVNQVRDYFVNNGIPLEKIQVDYQGELKADMVAQEYRKVEVFLVLNKNEIVFHNPIKEMEEEIIFEEVEQDFGIEDRSINEVKDEAVISSRDFERMKEDWKMTYDIYMDSIQPQTQVYKIDNDESHIVDGEKGTMIKIPENAFVYENGEAARGEIVFKLTEYYSKKEFISNNLSTISNGNLIKSAGMIDLEAKSMNNKLKLAEGKDIEILFPKMDQKYSTFYGTREDDGSLNWEIDEKYTKAEEINLDDFGVTTTKDGEGLELVSKEEAKKRNKKANFEGMDGIFIEVTPEYLDSLEEIQNQSLARWDEQEKIRTRIEAKNLGLINCDRFLDEKTSDAEILVQISNENVDALNSYLVFRDLNSMIQIREQEENIFFYNANLPIGRKVDLIVVGKDKDDKLYVHQSTLDISKKMKKNIKLEESTYEKLDLILDRL